MKGVIERTTQDIDNETVALFNEIEPWLREGYSICNAVKKVKNKRCVNTSLSWYKRIRDYAISRGYPADTDCMYR